MKSNYNKTPKIHVSENNMDIHLGWENILNEISDKIKSFKQRKTVILSIDTYQGVDDNEVMSALQQFFPNNNNIYNTKLAFKEEIVLTDLVFPFVTDDRI